MKQVAISGDTKCTWKKIDVEKEKKHTTSPGSFLKGFWTSLESACCLLDKKTLGCTESKKGVK